MSPLYTMSQSLAKGDWEITPVQAWFLLLERYDILKLLSDSSPATSSLNPPRGENGNGGSKVEEIKRKLGKITDCFGFGAVIDRKRFWEVVESVMGDE